MNYVAQPHWQENVQPPHVSRSILITTHVKSNPPLSQWSPKHRVFSEPQPTSWLFTAPRAAVAVLCVCVHYTLTYKYKSFSGSYFEAKRGWESVGNPERFLLRADT